MGLDELGYLKSYITIVLAEILPTNNLMFRNGDPKPAIGAFVDLLCRLLQKNSLLIPGATVENEDFVCASDIGIMAFKVVSVYSENKDLVEQVIFRTKIIKGIFHATTTFYRSKGVGDMAMMKGKAWTECFTRLIDQWTRLLVYKSMTRRFHKILRTGIVSKEALERVVRESVSPHGKEFVDECGGEG
ncbi:hypothetical protein AAF712_013477 [Marasmius tenuissimus]|uniref:Uncharacterized protein n=1 Tax=Marasmius tenuissimus TaxID=585030 RepID=A0ABR2ZET0_9AGAR